MGGFISKPKAPAPPPPVPTVADPAVNTQATAERLRRQKASGRQSTILSGNLGANDASAATQRSTLLGG